MNELTYLRSVSLYKNCQNACFSNIYMYEKNFALVFRRYSSTKYDYDHLAMLAEMQTSIVV